MAGLGIWLVSAILLGATVLVVHAVLYVAVFRAERSGARERVLALVPPLLPIVGWRVGLRVLSVFYCVLVVAYLILRASR